MSKRFERLFEMEASSIPTRLRGVVNARETAFQEAFIEPVSEKGAPVGTRIGAPEAVSCRVYKMWQRISKSKMIFSCYWPSHVVGYDT